MWDGGRVEGTDSGTRPWAPRGQSLEERGACLYSREKGDGARPKGKRGCPGMTPCLEKGIYSLGFFRVQGPGRWGSGGAVARWIPGSRSCRLFCCCVSLHNPFCVPFPFLTTSLLPQPECLLLLSTTYRSASCVSQAPSLPACATAHREG